MVVLTKKFRFIRDDVFLCPEVDTETGRQQVIIQKIDNETGKIESEEKIYCIHVCIASITPDEHKRYYTDPEFHEKFDEISLNIRSSANLIEIALKPEEKFVALKSWAEGIAEAGIDAFMVQNNIDLASGITAPLTGTLMRFMLKVDSVFLQDYITYVERTCSVDGVIHKTSFVANFLSLLEDIRNQNFIRDEYPSIDTIFSIILEPDPSSILFKNHLEMLIFRMMIEPNFLNRFLPKLKKIQTDQEFSVTLKSFINQILNKFKPENSIEMELLSLTKFERDLIVSSMNISSSSIQSEIHKLLLDTEIFLEFLVTDYNYFKNNNFEILTELIKGTPNEMIPFEKIIDYFYFQGLKEDSLISDIISDQRIKEPIVALLSKNPPISLFLKESCLTFFYAVYINDTLRELINEIANSCDEIQLKKFFNEILIEIKILFDRDEYILRNHFNKEYAIYFVNLIDEILHSTNSKSILGNVDEFRYIFLNISEQQKIINLGKKFGVKMSKENVYSIRIFNENFKDSLNLEDLKNLSVDQTYGLILEWESKKYLILNEEYKFDFSKYNIDETDYSYLRDEYRSSHRIYWELLL